MTSRSPSDYEPGTPASPSRPRAPDEGTVVPGTQPPAVPEGDGATASAAEGCQHACCIRLPAEHDVRQPPIADAAPLPPRYQLFREIISDEDKTRRTARLIRVASLAVVWPLVIVTPLLSILLLAAHPELKLPTVSIVSGATAVIIGGTVGVGRLRKRHRKPVVRPDDAGSGD